MKAFLKEYYNLDVVGYIKVTKEVYKVKTNKDYYYLKWTTQRDIETIQNYIFAQHIHCFVSILLNKENKIISQYKQKSFYLMSSIEIENNLPKEMKIKFYFETIAYLHQKSFYYIKVNQDYFKTLYQDIIQIINERAQYYDEMILMSEKNIYRSPSQWLLVMNYYRIYESLCNAKQCLSQLYEKTKDCKQVRVCLTYNNFDYDHISLKEKKLIAIDKIKIDLPLYDLFSLYQEIPDILFDLDCLKEFYFSKVSLLDYETLLLKCLMNIVPIVQYGHDEIENIIQLSRLLYYLDSIHQFNQ